MELSDATEEKPGDAGIDSGTFRLVAQCLHHYPRPQTAELFTKIVYVIFIYLVLNTSRTAIQHSSISFTNNVC
jgi:hypothetical protein